MLAENRSCGHAQFRDYMINSDTAELPPGPQSISGSQVCACFNVGLNTMVGAIRDKQLRTVQEVGEALQAGTNCGSCKPKIQSLLKTEMAEATA